MESYDILLRDHIRGCTSQILYQGLAEVVVPGHGLSADIHGYQTALRLSKARLSRRLLWSNNLQAVNTMIGLSPINVKLLNFLTISDGLLQREQPLFSS